MRLILAALIVAVFSVAAKACPEIRLSGQELDYSASELYQPQSFKVVAGGQENLERCNIRSNNPPPSYASGYVAAAPDFELYYRHERGYALEFRVVSDCDSVLLINTGAANWYFDDDDNGNLDAKIRLTAPSSGWYDIWIGTYDPSTCNATLTLETF